MLVSQPGFQPFEYQCRVAYLFSVLTATAVGCNRSGRSLKFQCPGARLQPTGQMFTSRPLFFATIEVCGASASNLRFILRRDDGLGSTLTPIYRAGPNTKSVQFHSGKPWRKLILMLWEAVLQRPSPAATWQLGVACLQGSFRCVWFSPEATAGYYSFSIAARNAAGPTGFMLTSG